MTSLYLWLAAIVIGGGGLAGIVTVILRNAKKLGQKTAEAEHAVQQAEDAKATGAVVAEHREPADAVKRLRNGTF